MQIQGQIKWLLDEFVISNPTSLRVRFRALTPQVVCFLTMHPFEYVFEPSPLK
jgi:hypothetical protein